MVRAIFFRSDYSFTSLLAPFCQRRRREIDRASDEMKKEKEGRKEGGEEEKGEEGAPKEGTDGRSVSGE